MPSAQIDLPIALSDTGPLISIFQSDSLNVLQAFFSQETRLADTDNDENRNADYAEDADCAD